jgi:hypothetical protein
MWGATMQDTNSFHGKQLRKISARMNDRIGVNNTYIVRSIAVIVHSTEKGSSSISTNLLGQKVLASWVFIKEVGHIMNETTNTDQGTRLGLGTVYTPRVNEINK